MQVDMERYVPAKTGAHWLGVSVSFFRSCVAPHVPCSDLSAPGALKRVPRYKVADLDRWACLRADSRRETAA